MSMITYTNAKNGIFKNPWLMFLPLLCIYILLVLLFPTQLKIGDEIRYFWYATNLTRGEYSPPPPDIILWNGPGYPLIITPLVALNSPYYVIALMNAIFMYLSVVLLHFSLKNFVSFRTALIFSLLWATYIHICVGMVYINTETFASFLVTLLLYLTMKSFRAKSLKFSFFTGIVLGYLILTKIIFAYVLLIMLTVVILLLVFNLKNRNYRKSLLIIIIAFLTTGPYLFYTFSFTGKFFYWGNSGGQQLYWMSTPFKEEYGDWISPFLSFKNDLLQREKSDEITLKIRHQGNMDEASEGIQKNLFAGVAQDQAFKRMAKENIIKHPLKYLKNCFANVGRMVFGFPFSYKKETPSTLTTLPWGIITSILFVFSIIPTILNWRKLEYSLRFMLLFVFIYLGGSSLIAAYPRMLTIVIPVLFLWFAFIWERCIRINYKFNS